MAGELFASTTTGQTVYGLLYNGTGEVWNGAAFVTPAAGGWSGYAISMPEVGGTGRYVGDMPTVPNGIYYYEACRQAGGTPATTDTVEYTGTLPWDGTEIADVQTILARLPAALVSGRMDAAVGAVAGGPLEDVPADLIAVRAQTDALVIAGGEVAASLGASERTAIATAAQDLADGVETGLTPRQWQRLVLAVLAGKSDAVSTPGAVAFKRRDGATVAVTVTYADGSRSAVALGTL